MARFDTIIRNGMIIDGTRVPRRRADLGISQGRVAKIGRLDPKDAERVFDADGCIVAPGFVDLHTHYDAQIFWDPYCTLSGWHGVTSVALGNCGFGFAAAKTEREKLLRIDEARRRSIAPAQSLPRYESLMAPMDVPPVGSLPKPSIMVNSYVLSK